jgi:hypothetical protein
MKIFFDARESKLYPNDLILAGDKPSESEGVTASVVRVYVVYSYNAEPEPRLAGVDSAYDDLKSCDACYLEGPFCRLAIFPGEPINR